jgi:hypothetical protein
MKTTSAILASVNEAVEAEAEIMAKSIEMSAAGMDSSNIAAALIEVAKRWVTLLDDPEGWIGEFMARLEGGYQPLSDLQAEYDRATDTLKDFGANPFINDE